MIAKRTPEIARQDDISSDRRANRLCRGLARWMGCLLLAGALVHLLLYCASGQTDAQEHTSFSFALTADMRSYAGPPYDSTDYFRGAAEAIARLDPTAFMVSPGDIDPPHEVYRIITQTLGVSYTWYPAVGNHELPGHGEPSWDWLQQHDYGPVNRGPSGCPTTTYSFDVQNAHLIVLNEYCDSAGPWATDGDIPDHLYNWLEDDLRATDKTHIFVIGHEPAYPQPDADNGRERHMDDSLNVYPQRRDRFWSLLQQEGVAAYFCGHTHNYSALDIDGVWQVDVGHARGLGDTGAPSTFVVIDVEGGLVTLQTYRDEHDGAYDYDDIVHRETLSRRAEFAASPRQGSAPLTVAFTNTSGCTATNSVWQFGDGVTSTLFAPTHTYTSGGSYTVTLTVSGTSEMCTATKPHYVRVYDDDEILIFVPLVSRDHPQ